MHESIARRLTLDFCGAALAFLQRLSTSGAPKLQASEAW